MLGFEAKLFSASNIWLHGFTPLFAIIMFLFVLRGKNIRMRSLPLIVVYPLFYLLFAYVLRLTTGAYVYPFLNPQLMNSMYVVAIAIFVIAVLFIGLGFVYRLSWNKRMSISVDTSQHSISV